ncbi:MAG TPA: hypothetical protein VFM88_21700 [Vicinamibacteria bacterium]|nr:hypothetical protein [Vicinamibacteria bacterium]
MPIAWATTSWTQVLAARDAASSESRQALEALCRAYWYPVYAFVRGQGCGSVEAQDVTQAYFAALIEKGYLEDFDPSLGRFRTFLKVSAKHFLAKEREKARAQKRGEEFERLKPFLIGEEPKLQYRDVAAALLTSVIYRR